MKPIHLLKLNKSLLWLFYPFLIFLITGYWKIPLLKDYVKEVISFGVFTTTLFCLLLLFNKKSHKGFLFILIYILLSFVGFMKLAFYHLFGVKISASALYVAFESNTVEISEFLQMYFSAFLFLLLVLFIFPLFLFRKIIRFTTYKINFLLKLALVLIVLFTFFITDKYFKNYHLGYVLTNSYKDYLHIKS